MSNMSYCRFENTVSDLRDCYENLDEVTSFSEAQARERLIKLAISIVNCAVEVPEISNEAIWDDYLATNFEEDTND